jgi:hypothetical protein
VKKSHCLIKGVWIGQSDLSPSAAFAVLPGSNKWSLKIALLIHRMHKGKQSATFLAQIARGVMIFAKVLVPKSLFFL